MVSMFKRRNLIQKLVHLVLELSCGRVGRDRGRCGSCFSYRWSLELGVIVLWGLAVVWLHVILSA